MIPFYQKSNITIYCGDCAEVLPQLDIFFDASINDPPYGLEFMGQGWDKGVPPVAIWKAVLNRLKPGAHNISFGGTRTYHRMAVAIEDAGFEIRDMLAWIFGQGPGLGQNIGKAIDKAAGGKREVVGRYDVPEAAEWEGWHTTLKPAMNPICLARRPLSEATVAANVLRHGVGGLNVGATRIGAETVGWGGNPSNGYSGGLDNKERARPVKGRYPSNLVLDDSPEVAALFPETTSGELTGQPRTENTIYGSAGATLGTPRYSKGSSGSATRYFYQAKANKADRYFYCALCQSALPATAHPGHGHGRDNREHVTSHPTVKPLDLMTYLCRFFLRPGAIILDPFMGSGTTLVAAQNLGMGAVGCDLSEEYCKIAVERLRQPTFFSLPGVEETEAGVVQGELFAGLKGEL